MGASYAIYFAPDPNSALAEVGERWLGRRLDSPDPVPQFDVPGLAENRLRRITRGPRHYGFHSSLKPPFVMADACSEQGLLEAAEHLAANYKPFDLGPLELVVIGKFVALTNKEICPPIAELASRCVRAFDGFRSRVIEDDFDESARQSKLSVHQERLKHHWGYPYVMEEYRFHMALTGGVADPTEREIVQEFLLDHTAEVAGENVRVDSLCVMRSNGDDTPITLLRRVPLSG